MSGTGNYAAMIERRFELVCKQRGLNPDTTILDTGKFRVPAHRGDQLALFDAQ
jgi:hypothetical protein